MSLLRKLREEMLPNQGRIREEWALFLIQYAIGGTLLGVLEETRTSGNRIIVSDSDSNVWNFLVFDLEMYLFLDSFIKFQFIRVVTKRRQV